MGMLLRWAGSTCIVQFPNWPYVLLIPLFQLAHWTGLYLLQKAEHKSDLPRLSLADIGSLKYIYKLVDVSSSEIDFSEKETRKLLAA